MNGIKALKNIIIKNDIYLVFYAHKSDCMEEWIESPANLLNFSISEYNDSVGDGDR